MGASFEGAWEAVEGAYYMGVGGAFEHIWLWVSIIMCVLALWYGNKHEADAFKKLKK